MKNITIAEDKITTKLDQYFTIYYSICDVKVKTTVCWPVVEVLEDLKLNLKGGCVLDYLQPETTMENHPMSYPPKQTNDILLNFGKMES